MEVEKSRFLRENNISKCSIKVAYHVHDLTSVWSASDADHDHLPLDPPHPNAPRETDSHPHAGTLARQLPALPPLHSRSGRSQKRANIQLLFAQQKLYIFKM